MMGSFIPGGDKMNKNTALPQPMSVRLIGNLRIQRGEMVLGVENLGGPKPRQILEILLLHRGTPVSKDEIIDLLWEGQPPLEALPTLESYVSVVRRHIQPGQGRSGPLRTVTGGYVIDRSLVDVDLDRFEDLVHAADQAPSAKAYGLLCEALSLTEEPLLGDELTPEWIAAERELHANRVTAAKAHAAEVAAELGRSGEAIAWAQSALAGDQLNERAWTALILGMEQAGHYAEGLQAYEKCRRSLHRELGCAPGPFLRAAYARLLSATADAEGDLADALSALLFLHQQLSQGGKAAVPRERRDATSMWAAGKVLNNFMRKAMAVA